MDSTFPFSTLLRILRVFFFLRNLIKERLPTLVSFVEFLLYSCVEHYKASGQWPVHLMFCSETIPVHTRFAPLDYESYS